jgi:DNA-binding IclR family transcriptional regulator
VPTSLVQSVDRAVAVLELLAARGSAGATELARSLDIHKSTAFRLLATLEDRGMVEREAGGTKYRLGHTVRRLARAAVADLDMLARARPALETLAEETSLTVTLAVPADGEVIYVEQVTRSPTVLDANWLGRSTPMPQSASGKVFLAYMSPERRREVLDRGIEPLTPHTNVDPAAYEDVCEAVRTTGYATTVEELEIGLNAVAAAVRSHAGEVVAAVSVSGASARLIDDDIERFGVRVRAAGEEISRRLGHNGVAV